MVYKESDICQVCLIKCAGLDDLVKPSKVCPAVVYNRSSSDDVCVISAFGRHIKGV